MVLSQPYYTEEGLPPVEPLIDIMPDSYEEPENLWERYEGAKPYAAPGKPAIAKQGVSWTQSYSKDIHTSATRTANGARTML